MESKLYKKTGALLLLFCVLGIYLPLSAKAEGTTNVVEAAHGAIVGFEALITTKNLASKLKPTVPTEDKDLKKNNFLTSAALHVSQYLINRMVDSTIQWANTGFDGGPAFAVDPQGFFTGVADGLTTDALNNIYNGKLGFVCSPFQRSLVISLSRAYYPDSTEATKPFQCSIQGIKGNIEDFYSDFNNGGWEAWFSISQVPTNNPYGAFLTAKARIDSQIARAVGVQEMELNWGGGFFSVKPCLERVEGSQECKTYGTTRTPGGFVKSGIENHINAEWAQLLDVQRFDQLLGALMGGLMQKYVFAKVNKDGSVSGGLIRDNYVRDLPTYTVPTPVDNTLDDNGGDGGTGEGAPLSCAPSRSFAPLNTPVTWSISSSLPDVPLSFNWDLSGDPIIQENTGSGISVSYSTEGSKTASVQAIVLATGELWTSATCGGSVFVSTEE